MSWSAALLAVLLFAALRGGSLFKSHFRNRWTAELAARHGWTWTARDDAAVDEFSGVPFEQGRSRRCTHVMRGVHEGRDVLVCDYQYTDVTGNDPRPRRRNFSVVALTAPTSPYLQVSPRTFFTPETGSPGDTSIRLGDRTFDEAFRVESPDRDFAASVLDEQVREFVAAHPTLSWSLRHGLLMVVEAGLHELSDLNHRLDYADGLLDRIPGAAWPEGPPSGRT